MPRLETVRASPIPSPVGANARLGTLVASSTNVVIAFCCKAAEPNVVIDMGTVCSFSERFSAVTMTSCSCMELVAVVAVSAACAAEHVAISMPIPARHRLLLGVIVPSPVNGPTSGRCGVGSPRLGGRGRCGGPFCVDELAQHPAEVHQRAVRQDGEHLEFRIVLERFLLSLNDRLVLHEALDEAVEQR